MANVHESKRGSNCTLTDGVVNRVLTLANTALTSTSTLFQIFRNGAQLVPTADFTPSHLVSSSTVTFLINVWDADYIEVFYEQSGTPSGTPVYCSTTDVYNKTGLSTSEVSSAVCESLILDAEAELEMLTGRKFTNANSFVEYISCKGKDILDNYPSVVLLNKRPVQSITAFNILDIDGNATSTLATLSAASIAAYDYDTADYWLETLNDPVTNGIVPTGKLNLKTKTVPQGINNVYVTGTYGYSTVPVVVKNLAICLSGMRLWIFFLGAGYNRLDSYGIPQQNVNKGDFYQRGKQNIEMLKEEADRLLERIGRKTRTMFFSTGGIR